MAPIWIIFIGISLLSYIVQANLNSKFKKFSKIPVGGGMTGRDVAEKMLRDNGIYDARLRISSLIRASSAFCSDRARVSSASFS